jgi:hypothetical protein
VMIPLWAVSVGAFFGLSLRMTRRRALVAG